MVGSDYLALIKKIDEKTADIIEKQQKHIHCRKGCHACCLPKISVSRIEATAIKNFFLQNPETREKAEKLKIENPHRGSRCEFLDSEGACVIYASRPVICRTHGLPVRVKEGDEVIESCCHLNFKDGLDQIDQDSWINLDLLNSLLALINNKYFPTDQNRFLLSVEALSQVDNETRD